MKKIIPLLLFSFFFLSACSKTEKLRVELDALKSQPPAKSVAGAELTYNKVATLATKITKEKEPPQQLLDSVLELQQQRAMEWKAIAIKQRAIGSAWKVFRALQESGAPVIDFDWSFDGYNSNPDETLKSVDPTRDTSGTELLERGKKK